MADDSEKPERKPHPHPGPTDPIRCPECGHARRGRDGFEVWHARGCSRAWQTPASAPIQLAKQGCDLVDWRTRAERAEARVVELEAEVSMLSRMTGADSSWPIHDVLWRLADAADHLLHHHNCDALGHEGIARARDAARDFVAGLRAATPGDGADEGGGA